MQAISLFVLSLAGVAAFMTSNGRMHRSELHGVKSSESEPSSRRTMLSLLGAALVGTAGGSYLLKSQDIIEFLKVACTPLSSFATERGSQI